MTFQQNREEVERFVSAFRKEIGHNEGLGHDREDVYAAIVHDTYQGQDEDPWDPDQLIGLWLGTTFLLVEAREEIEQLRSLKLTSWEGNRRTGQPD